MDLQKQLGFYSRDFPRASSDSRLIQYINLKLAVLGCPVFKAEEHFDLQEIASPLLANHREKDRLLAHYLCPADQRIHRFLTDHLSDVLPEGGIPYPSKTFVLDRHGLARALSLPPDKDSFFSKDGSSYRIKQGVLHNPKADRRTTQGVFHIAEGGLPVPDDKKEVPKKVYAELLVRAFCPPRERLRLPFTSTQSEEAETFVSLLLRPKVAPEVPGIRPARNSEIRFFAPGNLVSNLDFVESVFGNAGDPFLSENDAGLDVEHWSGHTGCVILATHLLGLKKKELGLPHEDEATPRQKRDGMCWRGEDELYNEGSAFKVTCRTEEGVMVTLIADSYFGYCKKEVKTQISYAANLLGNCEEEHAGGALAFPSYDLGDVFRMPRVVRGNVYLFAEVVDRFGEIMDLHEEGFGTDRKFPEVVYVPEDTVLDLQRQTVSWTRNGQVQTIKLLPARTYVGPSGYKVHMEKPPGGRAWRLIGTVAEGTFCHKPSTVSGGGSRKFPSRLRTRSCRDRLWWEISRRTSTGWRR